MNINNILIYYMNIYNILNEYYNKCLQLNKEYGDYSKEEKRERITNLSKKIDKYLHVITSDNKKKGDIMLLIHLIGMITLLILYIYIPINRYSIGIIIILGIFQIITNKYFGRAGCVVTRLERLYYNDVEWYGPFSFILLLVGKKPTRFNIDLLIGIVNIMVILYYMYRISKII